MDETVNAGKLDSDKVSDEDLAAMSEEEREDLLTAGNASEYFYQDYLGMVALPNKQYGTPDPSLQEDWGPETEGHTKESSAKKAGLKCPYCKEAITPETIKKHNECEFAARARGKAAKGKRAAKFNFGDRVKCTFTDVYSGIREGQEGTVDVVATFKGKSVHPDPAKRLLMVKWDDGQRASVPTANVEVISKGKGPNKVLPVTLLHKGKVVGRYATTDEAYAAAPQPWRKAYDMGYSIKQMTHAEEEKAKYGSEKVAVDIDALDSFTRAYIEAALWSSLDNDDKPLDADYSISDLAPQTLAAMKQNCEKFQEENGGLLQEDNLSYQSRYSVDEIAGHDFWLTQNGHGAGFWDGDWQKEAGEQLTKAAKKFRAMELYVGDDGLIYAGGFERFAG